MSLEDLEACFHEAVQYFWSTRESQHEKQGTSGKTDAGTRGAVTGGAQMSALEQLVVDLLVETGLNHLDVRTKKELELPGYYRPEKKWDLLVVSKGRLVTAIEFKSQVGPSFGNNFNNRVEEAVGSATDIWTAYREGRF
ncbi:MAG: restriction endonuclease, partial [Acidobacteria bacterium]